MALPPPKSGEMEAFYLVFGPMELSAVERYTTKHRGVLIDRGVESRAGQRGNAIVRDGSAFRVAAHLSVSPRC